MLKANRVIFLVLGFAGYLDSMAQPWPDSVRVAYNNSKTGAEKGRHLMAYLVSIQDDSLFSDKSLALANYFKEIHDPAGQDYVQLANNSELARTGNYVMALNNSLQVLTRFKDRNDEYGIMTANKLVSIAYAFSGDQERTIAFDKKVISLSLAINDKTDIANAYNNVASDYTLFNMADSGLTYAEKSVEYARQVSDPGVLATSLSTLGEIYIQQEKYEQAIPLLAESFRIASTSNILLTTWVLNDLGQIFLMTNKHDSAVYFARLAAAIAGPKGFKDQEQRAYEILYKSFVSRGRFDSAFAFYHLATTVKDSLFSTQKAKQVQAIHFQEQTKKQEIEQEKIHLANRRRTYALVGGVIIFSVIAFILYRNNKQKQKANRLLEATLIGLKSAQSQLIQSEKMASLGELTAGIAHEIQNPLNFVNNFSEVNSELITEMKAEIDKGNFEEVKTIATDIAGNEQKINHHGKRAGAIVKGMLQHSRSGNATKEPTGINKLADEYLRLAWHGLRAKDKSFDATIKTDYDENITLLSIVPQDIGRAILNLITNAFYAVTEKQKQQREGYEPIVTVTTRNTKSPSGNWGVEITVSDNGNGIPPEIVDKIFQPFFTTKPTGQGTGLGLSLSYDIIKAHGGELRVETPQGAGAVFIIYLPINS